MVSLLELVETIALRVDAEGRVVPASPAAPRWLAVRPAIQLPALFGCPSVAQLRALALRGAAAVPERPWPEGPVSWDLSVEPAGTVLALGSALRPPEVLAAKLARATLIDKSLALAVLPRERGGPLGERLQPKAFREATVMFIDAVQFSQLASRVDPVTCLKQLDFFFSTFDKLTAALGVEKLRTAGDTYMAVAGVPHRRTSHAVDAVLAALRCAQVVAFGLTPVADDWDWSFRIGLHSGPCISGVLGAKKPIYDLWGDTVSIASHVERVGRPDCVSVSGAIQQLIEPFFECVFDGTTVSRSAGEVPIYVVRGLRAEFAADESGVIVNEAFRTAYAARFGAPCPEAAGEPLAVGLAHGITDDDL